MTLIGAYRNPNWYQMYDTILVQAIECIFRNGSMKPKKALPLRAPTIIFIAIHS